VKQGRETAQEEMEGIMKVNQGKGKRERKIEIFGGFVREGI